MYGGLPNTLICEPEISHYKISKDIDFIFIGSDGVYDKL